MESVMDQESSGKDIKKKWNPYLKWGVYAYCFILACFIVLGFVTRMESVITKNTGGLPVQVTICKPIIHNIVSTVLKYNAPVLLLFGILSAIFRKKWLAVGILAALIIGYPVLGFSLFSFRLGPWYIEDQIKGPDGRIYCYMGHECLIAYTKSLTRLERQTLFTQTYKVLSDNPGDVCAMIIRPAFPPPKQCQQLYMTKSGLLLGLYDGFCYIAYDISSGRSWGFQSDYQRDFSRLSPFILIENGTAPYPPDVTAFYQHMLDYPGSFMISNLGVFKTWLSDKDPTVRDIAQKIINRYK